VRYVAFQVMSACTGAIPALADLLALMRMAIKTAHACIRSAPRHLDLAAVCFDEALKVRTLIQHEQTLASVPSVPRKDLAMLASLLRIYKAEMVDLVMQTWINSNSESAFFLASQALDYVDHLGRHEVY
jgi:hypothetical protein